MTLVPQTYNIPQNFTPIMVKVPWKNAVVECRVVKEDDTVLEYSIIVRPEIRDGK